MSTKSGRVTDHFHITLYISAANLSFAFQQRKHLCRVIIIEVVCLILLTPDLSLPVLPMHPDITHCLHTFWVLQSFYLLSYLLKMFFIILIEL